MKRTFLSDLHLESVESKTYQGFRATLQRAVLEDSEIYILGDLVEVWVGDDDDSELADHLRTDLAATASQVDVYLMHGNRDFLFRDQFATDTGVHLLTDPFILQANGFAESILLTHGDAYCTSDEAYMTARAMFRSQAWQDSILANTLKERRQLAKNLREQSKEANLMKADNITDVVVEELVAAMNQSECQTVIHGHTHRPAIHEHDGDIRRYVLGDWDRCGWVLRQIYDDLSLERFSLD